MLKITMNFNNTVDSTWFFKTLRKFIYVCSDFKSHFKCIVFLFRVTF